jgi:hypothetical protein
MLINNLSLSSSYNIIADSFKLAPISMSANTNILDNLLNINMSASLDPYSIRTVVLDEETGKSVERRFDELAWKSGSIGRITTATLAMSTNLNPKARSKETSSREKISKSDLPQQKRNSSSRILTQYVDFEIPWSIEHQLYVRLILIH